MSQALDHLSTRFEYTAGYYRELNPLAVRAAFLSARLEPPPVHTACELGVGKGISINVHAAASEVEWHGNDANAAHVVRAGRIAAAGGNSCRVEHETFVEFCARPDLPDFEFIGLHGVWTWVAASNRPVFVDFVRRKLRPGGVLYVSYNTSPGWGDVAPVRHLLNQHFERATARNQTTEERVAQSLDYVQQLLASPQRYERFHPNAAKKLEAARKLSLNYLVHEYFVSDWSFIHFADIAADLESAGLSFACSANLLDHADALNFPESQRKTLAAIADPVLRETVRDLIVNQQFRRDYWVKGPQPLTREARRTAVADLRVVLSKPRIQVAPETAGWLGTFAIEPAIFEPLMDVVGDHESHTVQEILDALANRPFERREILETVFMMLGAQNLSVANDPVVSEALEAKCQRFNDHVLDRAVLRDGVEYLASPVLGGGVPVDWLHQLFVLALRKKSGNDPVSMASFATRVLRSQGLRLVIDGTPSKSEDDNAAEALRRAREFKSTDEPLLRGLRVLR